MCYFCFSFRPCRAENWTFGKIVKKWTRITYFQFLSQIDFVFSIFYLFKKEIGARVFCSLRYCVLGKQFSVSVCSEFICDKLIWHRRTCGKKNLCRLIELDAIKNKNFKWEKKWHGVGLMRFWILIKSSFVQGLRNALIDQSRPIKW